MALQRSKEGLSLKFFFSKMVHTYHLNSKKKFSLQTIKFFLIFDQNAYVHQT